MNKLKLIVCGLAFLFACPVVASEVQDESGHIIPGSRSMVHAEWLEMQTARSQEDETAQALDIVESTIQKSSKVNEESIFKSNEAVAVQGGSYYSSHNGVFHSPVSISALGGMIELEDGSIWKVSNGDAYKTLNWLMSDLIVITPNHDWFSSCLFRMNNQNTGVSVKCNMNLGPFYNGHYTHWIVAINYYTQEIFLEDGSIWQVTGYDSSIFSKWLLNDTVVIGINDGFLSNTKPNILINVNTLNYVRAICTW